MIPFAFPFLKILSNPAAWKTALLIAVFVSGWMIKGWQVAGKELKVTKEEIRKADDQAKKDDKILADSTKTVIKIETIYRDKIVEKIKYVKTPGCVKHDPDYVRLYNESVAEFNESITRKANRTP